MQDPGDRDVAVRTGTLAREIKARGPQRTVEKILATCHAVLAGCAGPTFQAGAGQ